VGYFLALWAEFGRPPRLDQIDFAPTVRDVLHLHDIAIEPDFRGKGLVRKALDRLVTAARDVPLSLVAVHGTGPIWRSLGFVEQSADPDILRSYGADAAYMVRSA
jgi:ornithine decarboxylase